jgi:imidazolonepropionase-like amidohydrolase
VDAHTHFLGISTDHYDSLLYQRLDYRTARAAGEAYRLLRAGFTTVRCLGSPVSCGLSRAIEEGSLSGPRIVAAGQSITATNGTWDIVEASPAVASLQDMFVDGPDALRRTVRARVREGARCIKIGLSRGVTGDRAHGWGDDPTRQEVTYSDAEILAIVDETHAHGLKVSAHCIGDGPVRAALRCGVDVLEHAFGIDDQTRSLIAERGAPVVTTFTGFLLNHRWSIERGVDPEALATGERHRARMQEDFVRGRAAGITYALGSDLIGDPIQPQTAAVQEYATACEWGMTPSEALEAGLSVAAEVVGLGGKVGAIEPGLFADLVACPGDPSTQITRLRDIDFVMKAGNVVRSEKCH